MIDALIQKIKDFDLKTCLSLVAAAMFVYLTVTEKITGEVAMSIITMIFTYYFARKSNVEEREDDEL